MNFAQIRKYDVANGVGIRATLFVSGCHFNCPGCFNKEYQNFSFGNEFTDEEMQKFIDLGKNPSISGFSFLGGEPLDQINDDTLLRTVKAIKEQTGKTIWLWTGYVFENLNEKQMEIVKHIDVLVDGPFIEAQKDMRLNSHIGHILAADYLLNIHPQKPVIFRFHPQAQRRNLPIGTAHRNHIYGGILLLHCAHPFS